MKKKFELMGNICPVIKFDLKMKLTSLLLFISLFQVFANSYSQKTKITLNLKNVNVEKVLNEIETLTDFKFFINTKKIDLERTVSVNANKQTVSVILSDIFKNTSIFYEVYNKQIILKNKTEKENVAPLKTNKTSYSEQQKKISGIVKDKSGLPIPGVNIVEKGTSNGVQTDFDGKFSITISKENAVLVITYIGYKTQEIETKGKAVFNVVFEEDAAKLNEVVVIGYGQQSKAKIVGSVGQISSEELQNVASATLDQQLAGKISGVVINQSNGQPGADSQIVIRGTGTLTAGTNPLIVVDGFPLTEGSSLSAINPNDIADINVLKDAASAAIYGSRAANGVILVTTKKGSSNQKTVVTFDTYGGFQQQSSGVKLVDAYQLALFLKEARDWGYVSKDPANRSENDPNSVRATMQINGKGIDGRELSLDFLQPYIDGKPGLTNTNFMDLAFRNASISNYTISASGGNEKTKFYTSLGYFNQEGIVIGTDLKRYSASISLDTKFSDRVKMGINLKPSYNIQNSSDQSSRSSGVLSLLPLSFPYYSAYKEDGSLNISDQIINEQRVIERIRINGTPVENLVATATKVKDNKQRFRSFGNVYLDAELIKGFTYRLSMGGDYDSYVRDYYYPSDVGSYRTPAPRSDANSDQVKETKVNYLIENTITYKKEIGEHSFNLLAGHTFQKENTNYSLIKGTGFADNTIQNISGASAFTASSALNIWTLESYLARLQYDYNSKYLLSVAMRRDGSSRFGINNRWGNFPSLAVGWVLSNENFFPKEGIVNFTKISGSWGQTGNNQIGTYGSQALVSPNNYVFKNSLAPGYISTTAPNPNLGWEVASSMNIGLDLGLLKNKVNLGAAYYKTNTKDLLLEVPVPQQTGYSNVLANIGEMENKGFEFQLSGNNFNIGKFTLGFNTNLTSYKNKVLALGPGQTQIATGTDQLFITKVGHPIAEIYGYNITGIFKTQSEIDNTPHLAGTLTGDYLVQDVNNDGKINDQDKVAKGTFAPNFTYGFGGNIGYGGLNLSFNFVGVEGRTLMDGDMSSLTEAGEGFAVPSTYYFKNRYHPVDNPDGFLGQPNFGNFSNSRKLLRSSIVVQEGNGDYIRLRDIRLSYDLPKVLIQKLKFSNMQVYLSGNNVFTSTKYRGWNPDGTSSNILTSGFNNGNNYPIAKSYIFGLRISY